MTKVSPEVEFKTISLAIARGDLSLLVKAITGISNFSAIVASVINSFVFPEFEIAIKTAFRLKATKEDEN